jgi:hypothetical protein
MRMIKTFHGKVHGKTIEVEEELGLTEGQEVEVQVKIVAPTQRSGEGLRRSAGALANELTDEDDRILQGIYEDRKRDTRREMPQ